MQKIPNAQALTKDRHERSNTDIADQGASKVAKQEQEKIAFHVPFRDVKKRHLTGFCADDCCETLCAANSASIHGDC